MTFNMEHSEVWRRTLAALKTQMAEATYEAHLAQCEVTRVSGSTWTVSCQENSLDWLQHRLSDVVQGALSSVVEEEEVRVEWAAAQQPVYFAAEEVEEEESAEEETNIHGRGAYHTEWSSIVRPLDVEVFTQYFRREWRPILGTFLSELIRELRQRAYHGKGSDPQKRDSFKTTYRSLAVSLKVSEKTVKRAFERHPNGKFKNEYLGLFIKDMKVEKFRKADGTIRNECTSFIIYLDEPLTPKDEADLRSKLQKP